MFQFSLFYFYFFYFVFTYLFPFFIFFTKINVYYLPSLPPREGNYNTCGITFALNRCIYNVLGAANVVL